MSDERDDTMDALARAQGVDPDELRREVSLFRLALDADLSIAAAAADEEAPTVAADVLGADSAALSDFERRLRTRVVDAVRRRHLTHATRAARRRTAAVAAAAGLLGAVGGAAIAATAVTHSESRPSAVASSPADLSPAQTLAVSQADTLTYAAEHLLPTSTILAASGALRATLLPLMAQAPTDLSLASQLRSLLTAQRAALSSVPSPDTQIVAAIQSTNSLLTQLATGVTTLTPPRPGRASTAPSGVGSATSAVPTVAAAPRSGPSTDPSGGSPLVTLTAPPIGSSDVPGPG
ncbi:MAG TPA: hypothetical protein VIJ71_05185 [Mycobacteriales bacterium]